MAIIPRIPFYPIFYFMPSSRLHTSTPLSYHHLIHHLQGGLEAHGDCLSHLRCLNLLGSYCSESVVMGSLVDDLLQ